MSRDEVLSRVKFNDVVYLVGVGRWKSPFVLESRAVISVRTFVATIVTDRAGWHCRVVGRIHRRRCCDL